MTGLFAAAYPFADDVLALPVTDLDETVAWYGRCFGLSEVGRQDEPVPTVIMERDGVRIGFAIQRRRCFPGRCGHQSDRHPPRSGGTRTPRRSVQ